MMRRLLLLLIFGFSITLVSAQSQFTGYQWVEADLALFYPQSWDAPVVDVANNRLTLAQAFADNAEARPPAIPFITLTIIPPTDVEFDLRALLQTALADIEIQAPLELPTSLVDLPAIQRMGLSADKSLFGLGRAVILPDGQALLMVGRGLSVQQTRFYAEFDLVARSLTYGAGISAERLDFGFVWRLELYPAEGPDSFVSVDAMRLHENALYLADGLQGIIRLDATTGAFIDRRPLPEGVFAQFLSIAIGTGDRVYLSDQACGCVRVYDDGIWHEITAFAIGAPQSLAVVDDVLYGTDVVDNEVVIRMIGPDFERQIPLDVTDQPLLTVGLDGVIHLLTTALDVYVLEDNQVAFGSRLDVPAVLPLAFDVSPLGGWVVATAEDGLLTFDSDGLLVDQVDRIGDITQGQSVANVRGVATGANGTLYWVENWGSVIYINAVNRLVEAGRVGFTMLQPNRVVAGELFTDSSSQFWIFEGRRGDIVNLTAVNQIESGYVDLALRLIGPNGVEVAYNDNDENNTLLNPTDAYLYDVQLPLDGQYGVIVELVEGVGRYWLGFTAQQSILLTAETTTVLGELSEAIPRIRWQFDGTLNQPVTITLEALGGSLDPQVRLLDANGQVIAESDDASAPELGLNARIESFNLPRNGLYIIEVMRSSGEGRYVLTIEP